MTERKRTPHPLDARLPAPISDMIKGLSFGLTHRERFKKVVNDINAWGDDEYMEGMESRLEMLYYHSLLTRGAMNVLEENAENEDRPLPVQIEYNRELLWKSLYLREKSLLSSISSRQSPRVQLALYAAKKNVSAIQSL